MLEDHVVEIYPADAHHRNRLQGPRLSWRLQNVFEVLQRNLGLTINVDDVPDFLQRTENEERINPQREEFANRDLARKNQVKHQAEDRSAQRIYRRALNEAEAAEVLHFLQLEVEDFSGRAVEPFNFLLREPEALHQLDISQRLGC